MAKAEEIKAIEHSLKGEFKGVTLKRSETGALTFDVSALNNVDVTIITNGDGRVVKQTPVEEQANRPNGIASSVTPGAFNPANAMVEVGDVTLGTLSVYLREAHEHFPDLITEEQSRLLIDHPAKLLAAPMDTSLIRFTDQSPENMAKITDLLKNGGIDRIELLKIVSTNLSTFNQDIATIRNINETHGIHHNGQALTGMEIYDRSDSAPNDTYEKNWAKNVVADFLRATNNDVTVTTDLAAGMKQAVHGREIGTRDVTVTNNLYSNAAEINTILKAQGGQEIITSNVSDFAHWQRTATEDPDGRPFVSTADFTLVDSVWLDKSDLSSCRPLALEIAPSP